MPERSDAHDIVELLADHEQAISRLYQTYAARFPLHRDFWSQLADEEQQHAKWLRRLLVRVGEGLGYVRPDRVDATIVRNSLARIEKMTEEAHESGFSFTQALDTAMTIEKTLLEAEYFQIFEGTAPEVLQVQYFLTDAVREHCQRIQQMT
jgi:rubrerythrin